MNIPCLKQNNFAYSKIILLFFIVKTLTLCYNFLIIPKAKNPLV